MADLAQGAPRRGDHRSTNRLCPYLAWVKRVALSLINIPERSLDPSFDRCFCAECTNGQPLVHERGEPAMAYSFPVSFARLGLHVDPGMVELHDIFKKWPVCFHGTKIDLVGPLFKGRLQLLKPGDVAIGGKVIEIRPGHIEGKTWRTNFHTREQELFDPHQIFLSPSPVSFN